MAKNKTTKTKINVTEFINSYVDNDQKKLDSFRLIELMREWTGFEPKMWGPTIIGFGSYHYKYASGHEGDAPLIGFSPRKPEFSLYVFCPGQNKLLLKNLVKQQSNTLTNIMNVHNMTNNKQRTGNISLAVVGLKCKFDL